MRECSMCGDKISGEEVAEWKAEHEEFSLHPLICPDCWDRFQQLDPEKQVKELIYLR